ncbi:hypothetical protein [Streptomyces marincola]|uniref:hypothetical protein n=1 Tax=Streptomyces marincola TaxID=2878388 RepID=UPI00131EA2E7|nr:hypothetical protein [Streptomyces marincola]
MTSLTTADPSRSSGPASLADTRAALRQALMDRAEFAAGRAVCSAVDAGADVEDLPHLTDRESTFVARGRRDLVRATAAGLEERLPFTPACTAPQREHTARDIAHLVDILAISLYVDDVDLCGGFLAWPADILEARGVPSSSLPPALDLLSGELTDFPRATRHLAHGRATLGSRPSPPLP